MTHDAELAAMADARLVLRDGRVVERTGILERASARGMRFVLRRHAQPLGKS